MRTAHLVAIATLGLLVMASGGANLAAQEEGAAAEPATLGTLMAPTSAGNTAQAAQQTFYAGERELKRALKLAEKAAATEEGEKAEKLREKSQAAFESAVAQLTTAVQQNPKNLEAYEALGLGLRRLGKYQDSLQVHAVALRQDPNSLENFRGWSESLMGLDMLGNATNKYMELAESGSPYAPVLMDEIREWLVAKQADPGDLDPEAVQRLADWIAQQERG